MNDRSNLENAFGLRWIQDDEQGRLVCGGGGDYRTPADAIRSLGLGCEEAALQASLDRFPPRVRIHGGYTPSVGEAVTRFTLTWEPGAAEAAYVQTRDDSEDMSGHVDVPAGGALKEVLKELLIPDAEDVVGEACDKGKTLKLKDVDFWIGDQHFVVTDEQRT